MAVSQSQEDLVEYSGVIAGITVLNTYLYLDHAVSVLPVRKSDRKLILFWAENEL